MSQELVLFLSLHTHLCLFVAFDGSVLPETPFINISLWSKLTMACRSSSKQKLLHYETFMGITINHGPVVKILWFLFPSI